MNTYTPRTEDMHFVLSRVLNAADQLQALPHLPMSMPT